MARDAAKAAAHLPSGVPVRLANYDDPASLDAALAGVERVVLVPSDGEAVRVIEQHAAIIDALRLAGVTYTVFISIGDVADTSPFYFAPVYRDAERRLREAGLSVSLLRCNVYAEFVRDRYLRPALATGTLDAPFGDARLAPVSREDVAACATALICTPELAGRSFPLTGPAAFDGRQLATMAGDIAGRAVAYAPLAQPDYLLKLWNTYPAPWPHAFATMAQSIAQGRYGDRQDGVATLIGRSPRTMTDVLRTTL